MSITDLISIVLATLLFAGTALAQNSLTPEDVLSIREIRELQISPDGKQVAFRVREAADPKLRRVPRVTNIWTVSTDGKEPAHPLIPNLKNANTPRWSPDGRSLAFLSDHENSDVNSSATIQIYLLRIDSGKTERLTSVPSGVKDFAWSPDGTMIAFVARDQATAQEVEKQSAGDDAIEVDRNFKYTKLWVVKLSDRKAVQITKQDFEINEIAWSPRGDEVALVVARTQKAEDSLLFSLVVVSRLTGDVVRTLSANAAPISGFLRWSPNGALITFLEGPPTKEFASWLAVVPANGGSVRALTKDYSGTVLTTGWTSDSKRLLAQSIEWKQSW